MALPTKSDLVSLGYSFNGEPFVDVPANSTITLAEMTYSYNGEPFVRNEDSAPAASSTPLRCLMGVGA